MNMTFVLLGIMLLDVPTDTSRMSVQQSWPQWRGPQRTGQIDAGRWPETLEPALLREQFRVPLDGSYSGPIVSDQSVFVTETIDEKSEVVRALDRTTGRELWRTNWPGALSVPFFAKANGDWIRSTPALDDGRLYVAGMRDVLACLDAPTGSELWRVDFVKQLGTPLPAFGFVSSPLVDGEDIYVQAGGGLAKLDKQTGQVRWTTLADGGGMSGSAFSSPVIDTICGKRQLIVQTRTSLAGVDLASGQPLWTQEVPAFRGMNILTPLVIGGSVLTSSYGGGTFLYRLQEEQGKFSVHEEWKSTTQGYMSTPVLVDGYVYLHLRNQRLTCIDPRTGDNCWTTQPFGKYWSMVVNGDRILALDESGKLRLIEASPGEFRLLDERSVTNESCWAHLAVAGSQVFVRSLNSLIGFEWTR